LRVEDRFCNYCRELATYRLFERTQVLAEETASFATWKATYRAPFYQRFGFFVPAVVPQTNNVGEWKYEACTP
jgi:hypothetical protein